MTHSATHPASGAGARTATPVLRQLWSGRCPVPTASGIALHLGWLAEEFAPDGIEVRDARTQPRDARGPSPHDLPSLFREGGNIPVLAARAQGEASRLVGLTWIDEGQSIIVRPGSGVRLPQHLKGLRVALPAHAPATSGVHTRSRGGSIWRGMTLHGFSGALAAVGLGLDDVHFVEVESSQVEDALRAVADGRADAAYVKGAAPADTVRALGLEVGIDLDQLPERRFRVNNGTPRPLTVHQSLLDDHFDVVVRALYQSLRAAEWAKTHLEQVQAIYASETRGSAQGVAAVYRNGFHQTLHPQLTAERLALFGQQKDFLLLHGFLDRDVDLDAWADPRPLAAAWQLLAERKPAAVA